MGLKRCKGCGGLGTVEVPKKDWNHKEPGHVCHEYCHDTVDCSECGGSGRVSSGKPRERL